VLYCDFLLLLDNVLEFCRLADANHRYHTVSKLDAIRLQKLIAIEQARESATASSISLLEKRLRNVSDTSSSEADEAAESVQQGLSLIEKELSNSTDALQAAETEEERARLAYERACQARKKAASKVSALVDTVSTIQTHKKMIADVSAKRLDMAKYSHGAATEGIQLLSEFQNYMQSVQSKVGTPQIDHEIPAIFSHLISSFTSYLSRQMTGPSPQSNGQLDQFNVVMADQMSPYFTHFDAQSADDELAKTDQTLRCLAQIGLEMTRLWRQLNAEDTYPDEVWATITKFEQTIQTQFLKKSDTSLVFPLRDNVLRDPCFRADTQHIPRYQDTTVVLHYDHWQHLTPKWHFENIHRYDPLLSSIGVIYAPIICQCYDLLFIYFLLFHYIYMQRVSYLYHAECHRLLKCWWTRKPAR
jgi:hypothetical protein